MSLNISRLDYSTTAIGFSYYGWSPGMPLLIPWVRRILKRERRGNDPPPIRLLEPVQQPELELVLPGCWLQEPLPKLRPNRVACL